MKMKFLCCRYKIVYICEQVKINGKVLKHQQTVFNKSCSFAYNLLMKCVSCFYKKLNLKLNLVLLFFFSITAVTENTAAMLKFFPATTWARIVSPYMRMTTKWLRFRNRRLVLRFGIKRFVSTFRRMNHFGLGKILEELLESH